ncbi:daptide biosynthesis RiPP recognition protein [Rathayibacter rathayi]|uniref:daptide biosynthesis RiPP recognition protein n=1 Tax=Rathayibacter rathayi TaxID=33887 RepID=UPI0030B8E6FE
MAGRYVEAWITGRVLLPGQAIGFAEDDEAAGLASANLIDSDILFVPTGVNVDDFGGTVVEYDGRFRAAGDEITVCGHTVELQDYLASGFVDIVGPTCAQIQDLREWDAFIADADEVRSGAPFPRQFLESGLLLGGTFSLLAESSLDGQSFRPYFSKDGKVFAGPQGKALDALELQEFRSARPGAVAEFEGAVPSVTIERDCGARPWLGRYIRAFELLKRTNRDADACIIGFGHSILDDGLDDAAPSHHAPYLSLVEQEVVLEDLATGRRFRTPLQTAAAVEALMTSSERSRSEERLAGYLAIGQERARRMLDEVASQFGFESPASLQRNWVVSKSSVGRAR